MTKRGTDRRGSEDGVQPQKVPVNLVGTHLYRSIDRTGLRHYSVGVSRKGGNSETLDVLILKRTVRPSDSYPYSLPYTRDPNLLSNIEISLSGIVEPHLKDDLRRISRLQYQILVPPHTRLTPGTGRPGTGSPPAYQGPRRRYLYRGLRLFLRNRFSGSLTDLLSKVIVDGNSL